jgi:hypothetical protein
VAASEYDAFISSLPTVAWFAAIGTHVSEPNTVAMASWDEWPGPDSKDVERISLGQQAMRDLLEQRHPDAMSDFDAVVGRVVAIASKRVPFDPEEDAWHAPTTAVWHAAWTAALYASHLRLRIAVPAELTAQWVWFERGHWPAGYTESGALLIY